MNTHENMVTQHTPLEKMEYPQENSASLLEKYEKYRELGRGVIKDILQFVPKDSFLAGAKQLGISKGKNIHIGSESESAMLYDFIVHHFLYNGKTALNRYVERNQNKFTGDLLDLSVAKGNSYYAILKFEEYLPDGGIVVHDMLRNNQQKLLIDKGLNLSNLKPMVIATTVVEFTDFIMTTGAAVPVVRIMDYISNLLDSDFKDFANKSKNEQSKLVAKFYKYCFSSSVLNHIKYI